MISKKYFIYLFMALAAISSVNAHLIGGSEFESGALHPFSGIDHILAMIAVGIISTRYGKAILAIPLIFISSMIAGGIAGMAGFQAPLIEAGIALSVIFLGFAVFIQRKLNIYLISFFVALSAIFHGHAHGSEMPLIISPAWYYLGFVLSTAFLHISGVLIGHYAKKAEVASKILRYAGAGMGAVGIYLFLL